MDKVSITITTKNEEKNIENCLKSIVLQDYPDMEIIVVDNGSTDKTKELAQKYTELVFDKGPERSAQRNFGMLDHSSGTYVMFIDADMVLSPGLVTECVRMMQTGGYLALHIPEIVLGKNYFSRVRRFERSFYDGTVIDGARFFQKEAFQKAGGFDINMSGPEDWDIDKKIKKMGSIGLLKTIPGSTTTVWPMVDFIRQRGVDPVRFGKVIYHNESEFDLGKYLAKKGYYAASFENYIAKWGKSDPDIQKQFGLLYRYFGVYLEKGKWIKVLLHPLLTAGMFFLRFMVGVKFLTRKK